MDRAPDGSSARRSLWPADHHLVAVSLMASGFHVRQAEWLPAIETALWATLAAVIATGRWDEMSTGPSVTVDVLGPVVVVLVPAIIVILVMIVRQPVQPAAGHRRQLTSAG